MAGAAGDGKGQAARLGAEAPVAAARTEHGAEIALPADGHAQRTVDENLQFHTGAFPVDFRDFFQRQFACEHHPAEPGFFQRPHARGSMDARLGGSMQLQFRGALRHQARKAHILHQQGIHRQRAGSPHQRQRIVHFAVEQEGIDGKVNFYIPHVAVFHGGLQPLRIKIGSARAGAEPLRAEVDRVGSGADGGLQAFGRTGRCKDFRLTIHRSSSQKSS